MINCTKNPKCLLKQSPSISIKTEKQSRKLRNVQVSYAETTIWKQSLQVTIVFMEKLKAD